VPGHRTPGNVLVQQLINMENLFAGLFGLLLGAVGMWTGFKQLKNRASFSHWKSTQGHVLERGTYRPANARFTVPAFQHSPLIKYQYEVDSREFVSNSIYPIRIQLPAHGSLKWAEKKAASFPDEVVVHYNPEEVSESYLILTSRWTLYAVLICSFFALCVGGLFLLSWIVK